MILDNISRALKEQNWLAAAIEFVIVIFGVVIGFQIQAWNESRAAAAQGVVNLALVRDEVKGHVEAYAEMTERAQSRVTAINYLINATTDPTSVAANPIELPHDLVRARFRTYQAPNRVVYEGLESRGAMALMPTARIVSELRTYYQEIGSWDIVFGEDKTAIIQFETASAGYLTGPQMEALYADNAASTPAFENFGAEQSVGLARRLSEDREFMKWLHELYDHHRGIRDMSHWQEKESRSMVARINEVLGEDSADLAATEPAS